MKKPERLIELLSALVRLATEIAELVATIINQTTQRRTEARGRGGDMSDDPENTGGEREEVGFGKPPKASQFKPGNPGRPKGSRNKLGEAFIEALHDDFQASGVEAITAMRANDPGGYVRVIASLLPKEFKIETTSDLTDEQLDARIRALASLIEVGAVGAAGGSQEAEGPQTAH